MLAAARRARRLTLGSSTLLSPRDFGRIGVSAEPQHQHRGDDDVDRRAGDGDEQLLARLSGMRSSVATPPMGSSVTSGVGMPKRRAMKMWPNSCASTQANSRIMNATPLTAACDPPALKRGKADPGEQQQKRDVYAHRRSRDASDVERPGHVRIQTGDIRPPDYVGARGARRKGRGARRGQACLSRWASRGAARRRRRVAVMPQFERVIAEAARLHQLAQKGAVGAGCGEMSWLSVADSASKKSNGAPKSSNSPAGVQKAEIDRGAARMGRALGEKPARKEIAPSRCRDGNGRAAAPPPRLLGRLRPAQEMIARPLRPVGVPHHESEARAAAAPARRAPAPGHRLQQPAFGRPVAGNRARR